MIQCLHNMRETVKKECVNNMQNRSFKLVMVVFFLVSFFVLMCFLTKTDDSEASNQSVSTSETSEFEQIATTTVTTTQHVPEKKSITISFLGDCMLASYKGQVIEGNMNWCLQNYDSSYFFEKAMPYIGNDDFTVTNCECVLSDTSTVEVAKNHSPAYWYRSGSKTASVFKENSIDAVAIANNHIADYGMSGKQDTMRALEDAGVLWGNDDQMVTLEKDGIKIGLILCNFWGSYQQDSIVSRIHELSKTTDIQIVYFHGGEMRIHFPEKWKVNGAHAFVDAGADLVLGAHPHALQPHEEYNGVDIVYSLGNFCYGGSKSPENRTIIYQESFEFEDGAYVGSQETIIPFYVYTGATNNWQPGPITNEQEKNAVLDFMYGNRTSPF